MTQRLVQSWFFGGAVVFLACNGSDSEPSAADDTSASSGATGTGSGADGADASDGVDGSEGADSGAATAINCDEEELSALYTRYVEPFVSGAVPSSCGECHMTGVDMSMYAQDTPCDTMACMVSQGVVSLAAPDKSSLLSMISMGDPESSVFDVNVEHGAMLQWIEWSAQCHSEVCGDTESPCAQNTGAGSTGINPIGDCSEEDLLVTFWDSVIVDRGRCLTCHSDWGQNEGTFGSCTADSDCEDAQVCGEGLCRAPGPYQAPHFFEGVEGALDYENPEHRQLGMSTMYNVIALGMLDVDNPEDSTLITKPLLEDFTPTAVFGPNVNMPSMPAGVGIGIAHGGTSKFNFGCHEEPCPTEAVVDCRVDTPCGDGPCADGMDCMETGPMGEGPRYCRATGSVCDATLEAYYGFANYFAACNGG